MAYIVSCDPVDLIVGRRVIVQVPSYEGASPMAGDVAFLWFSRKGPGAGLAGRGQIEAVSDDHPMDLAIQIDAVAPPEPLALEEPGTSSNDAGGSPGATLARKIYRDSLTKVARLEAEEAELLARSWHGEHERRSSRYGPLRDWLLAQTARELVVSFDDLEQIIGSPLPASAERPQWWANTTKTHTNVQREAWRAAGYNAFLMKHQGRVRFVKTHRA